MTLGEHILTLRKQKGFSQSDLGKQIKTSGDIIGPYERNEVKPIEVIVRMADALEVSIDFLVGKSEVELDTDTLSRIREVSLSCPKGNDYRF